MLDKDLTYHCLYLCHNIMQLIVVNIDRIPFVFRAMMRIVIEKAQRADGRLPKQQNREEEQKLKENMETFSGKIELTDDDIHLLAELLVGCWLNTGFRNPSCFGVLPTVDREQEF